MILLKRIYEPAAKDDGFRILVDRLWPRGISKANAKVDLWLKEIGPSTGLRTWFGHKPERWEEFKKRYAKELKDNEALSQLRALIKEHKVITLLYGAKDTERNQAVVIKSIL